MTDTLDPTKAIIRRFVLDTAATKGIATVGDDESLIVAGIVDSLGIFQLVAFLQDEFEIPVEDHEITPEHFRSIATIERFVTDKVAADGTPGAR
jgi:acyl carrier protein